MSKKNPKPPVDPSIPTRRQLRQEVNRKIREQTKKLKSYTMQDRLAVIPPGELFDPAPKPVLKVKSAHGNKPRCNRIDNERYRAFLINRLREKGLDLQDHTKMSTVFSMCRAEDIESSPSTFTDDEWADIRCDRDSIPGVGACSIHSAMTPGQLIAVAKTYLAQTAFPALQTLDEISRFGRQEGARVAAARDLLDRSGLKQVEPPKESTDLSMEDLSELSDDELKTLMFLLNKAKMAKAMKPKMVAEVTGGELEAERVEQFQNTMKQIESDAREMTQTASGMGKVDPIGGH